MEHYQIDDVKYSEEDITDSFVVNRDLFVTKSISFLKSRNANKLFTVLQRLDSGIYPDEVFDENGCIILTYYVEESTNTTICFYIDKLNNSFCGYHIF